MLAKLSYAVCLMATMGHAEAPFTNSIVSNDLAFITSDDPNSFNCVAFVTAGNREMPDPRKDDLFADAMIYEARFGDGVNTQIWLHDDIGDAAGAYAQKVGQAMGHLPTILRQPLDHVVVLNGDGTAFGEDQGRFFVLFADNIDTRLANDDLEETIFHESIHASLDIPFASSPAWKAAQSADADAITRYAANNMAKEDLAESALFAFTQIMTPDRLPTRVINEMLVRMPNRFDLLQTVFDPDARFEQIAAAKPCG